MLVSLFTKIDMFSFTTKYLENMFNYNLQKIWNKNTFWL